MPIYQRRRVIPDDMRDRAPDGAERVLERWPQELDAAARRDTTPEVVAWLDADGQVIS